MALRNTLINRNTHTYCIHINQICQQSSIESSEIEMNAENQMMQKNNFQTECSGLIVIK